MIFGEEDNEETDEQHAHKNKNNDLGEDEHEEMVLDRASDYKMVSIMRQKRAVIIDNDNSMAKAIKSGS